MRLYHFLRTAALATLATAQLSNLAFTSTPTNLRAGSTNTITYNVQNMSTYTEGLPISGANVSAMSTASIANLPVIVTGSNSSLANHTAPLVTNMSLTAAPVVGSGVSMGNKTIVSRNQTMSSGILSEPSSGVILSNGGASSTAGGAVAEGVSTASSTQATASSTSSAGAAVGSMNVGSGSTLALVLAAVAVIVL